MNNDHEQLSQLLRSIDTVHQPDSTFAAQLKERITAGSSTGAAPSASSGPIRLIPRPFRTAPRHRLFDLAAVAVLLLSMIGGLASTTTGGDPTPTIQAPEVTYQSPSVMTGGTAAQDRQYSTSGSLGTEYDLAWTMNQSGYSYVWPALAYQSTVYTMAIPWDNPYGKQLSAWDIATGEIKWQSVYASAVGMAITPLGVATAIVPEPTYARPDETIATPFQIVLLDLETGERIWQSTEIYGSWDGINSGTILVEANTIYFEDAHGRVAALDLRTGIELWRYEYERTLAAGAEPEVCYFVGTEFETCMDRANYATGLAIHGDSVYIADNLTLHLFALDSRTGTLRWDYDIRDRTRLQVGYVGIMATSHSVLVQARDTQSQTPYDMSYLAKWDANTGDAIWTSNRLAYLFSAASDGTSLFVGNVADTGALCCGITSISLLDGSIEWTLEMENAGTILGYLPESDTLLISVSTPVTATIGINVQTREQTGYYRNFQNDCRLILPISEDGYLVCSGQVYGLRVMRPVNELATPQATP